MIFPLCTACCDNHSEEFRMIHVDVSNPHMFDAPEQLACFNLTICLSFLLTRTNCFSRKIVRHFHSSPRPFSPWSQFANTQVRAIAFCDSYYYCSKSIVDVYHYHDVQPCSNHVWKELIIISQSSAGRVKVVSTPSHQAIR